MRRCTLTWTRVLRSEQIASFEDPIYGFPLDKQCFQEVYDALLQTLDGSDFTAFVDWFFRPSPINTTHWEFFDADTRQDFVECAQELGLLLTLQELYEGESAADKRARQGAQAV